MKIIFVIASMTGGGSERVMANLSNEMISLGHEISIIMTANNDVAYELHEKIKTRCIGNQTGGSILKRFARIGLLRKIFKENKEATIISFGTETNLFTILASLGLKNKVILSERNDPNQCSYKPLRNMIYAMGKYFSFQTKDAKEYFSNKIQRNSTVIPNPLRDQIPESFQGTREKNIVAVGRLTVQKNHLLLIEAFAEFAKSHTDYKLIIYGKGELQEELEKAIGQLGLKEAVLLPGFSKDVLEEIKTATMYVLSSDYEGISNSLAEAMAIGLPVISTDCPIGGSRMLINDGENGLLVPMNDSKKLSEAMCKVADDAAFAKLLSKEAQKIREKLSIQNITKQWMDFINRS